MSVTMESPRKGAGITALVIDDSAVARRAAIRALELTPLDVGRVIEAADAESGLALMADEPVGLVLVDLNMRGMGGLAFVELLRVNRRLRRTPIVVISSDSCGPRIARIHQLGAGYLRKPYTPEAFVHEVQAVIDAARDRPHDEILFDVAARVMGELCFLFTDDDGHDPVQPDELTVTVPFAGAASGEVTLSYGGLDLPSIAGNMMGVPPDDTLADDAALELASVVCAHALPALFGAEKVFRVEAPRFGGSIALDAPLVAETVMRIGGGVLRAAVRGGPPA